MYYIHIYGLEWPYTSKQPWVTNRHDPSNRD